MSTQDLLTDIYDKIQGEPATRLDVARVSTVQYSSCQAPAVYCQHVAYTTVYKCQLAGSEVTDNKGRYIHKQAIASSELGL